MKSLGQVGYEAMLELLQSRRSLEDWEKDPSLWVGAHDWKNQPQKLRDDWKHVAKAIHAAARKL